MNEFHDPYEFRETENSSIDTDYEHKSTFHKDRKEVSTYCLIGIHKFNSLNLQCKNSNIV